tara:strand:+ start:193 stop:414 length:222 start_codon:yes stop_codon:yes gene_type:complete
VNTLGAPAVTLIIEEHSDDDLRRLMIDPFGNYLFQKLVEGSDVSDCLPWMPDFFVYYDFWVLAMISFKVGDFE